MKKVVNREMSEKLKGGGNSMTQEEINKIIHLAKIAFCESCGCGIPRDTCISLGTCDKHDAFARILREKLKGEGQEMKFAAQKFHNAKEKMNETFKEKVSCRLCKFYENNCPLSVGYAEKNNGLLFCYPNRICDDFEFREVL